MNARRGFRTLAAGLLLIAGIAVISQAACGHHHSGRPLAAIDWRRDFSSFSHSDGRFQHQVLVRGSGLPVLLLHELPGPTNEALDLAERLAGEGFQVYLPILFGQPGERAPKRNLVRACGGPEFKCLSGTSAGPVVGWLRHLSRAIHERHPNQPMGAVGMCFTGSISLELAVDPWVVAPVLSQPALPIRFGASRLAVRPEALDCVRERKIEILAFRFSEDGISPRARWNALHATFPGQVRGMEIDSRPGNRDGIHSKAHAVLSTEYVPKAGHPTERAYRKLLAFLREKLRGPVPTSLPKACPAPRPEVAPSEGSNPSGSLPSKQAGHEARLRNEEIRQQLGLARGGRPAART